MRSILFTSLVFVACGSASPTTVSPATSATSPTTPKDGTQAGSAEEPSAEADGEARSLDADEPRIEKDTLAARRATAGENAVCNKLRDDGDNFQGSYRGAAKTMPSTAEGRLVDLADLLHGFRSGPLADAAMRTNHDPKMSEACDFGRVAEEDANVTVEGWAVASKKEPDNDFHIILSADADPGTTPDRWRLLNVEISGLPPPGTPGRQELVTARKAFKDDFGQQIPDHVTKDFVMLKPAVHVRVTGSLFFDVDHAAGAVGPPKFKPKTAWEIHPITSLKILE